MDWLINDALPVSARICSIFPFSFLDKILNWDAAAKQRRSRCRCSSAMAVELLTPPMMFGICDGIAAFILAGYCAVTGIVYHNFWTYPRFWSPDSEGYPHVWDFFKGSSVD